MPQWILYVFVVGVFALGLWIIYTKRGNAALKKAADQMQSTMDSAASKVQSEVDKGISSIKDRINK